MWDFMPVFIFAFAVLQLRAQQRLEGRPGVAAQYPGVQDAPERFTTDASRFNSAHDQLITFSTKRLSGG